METSFSGLLGRLGLLPAYLTERLLEVFVEHLYSISFLSFLKIFQLVAYKGFWSMVFPIKDFSLAVDEW